MNKTSSEEIFFIVNRFMNDLALGLGFQVSTSRFVSTIVLIALYTVLLIGIHISIRFLLRQTLRKASQKSNHHIFRYLLKNRFAHMLAYVAPVILLKNTVGMVFYNYPNWVPIVDKLIDAYIVLMIVWLLMAMLSSWADVIKEHPSYKGTPLDSYLQVIRMVLFLYAIIILFSMFTGKSPLAFFTAMGAMSAVLMLMFKDTIMGFVASIQVTTNDMIRIGDWVAMPKYGADGTVTEINLTTVKIQNFDRTITTVPTYALISDSFRNWRGMQESGGRRIKRPIYIKQSSVRFIEEDELDKFKKIQGIQEYIVEKNDEIQKHNESIGADRSLLVNGRNLTNLGLFRIYAIWYLEKHPHIRKDMSLMVRQLDPTERGIPMEIYAFANTTLWVPYEGIAGDVFDHLIASVKYFDLEIFEVTSDKIALTQSS